MVGSYNVFRVIVTFRSTCEELQARQGSIKSVAGYWTHYEQVITSNDNTSNVVTSNDITSNGHTKMGILQFFPLVLIAYFPRHNKRCYESEMNSHFHSIFCLTSEKKTICVSKSFPGEVLLNYFPKDNVTLDQFLQLENCNAKTN